MQIRLMIALPLLLAFSPVGFAVDAKAWVETLHQELPLRLCAPKQYFVNCFNVTEPECVVTTTLLVEGCLNGIKDDLPKTLDEKDSAHWGGLVARCTADLYDKFMHEKRRESPECNLPIQPEAPAKTTAPNTPSKGSSPKGASLTPSQDAPSKGK